MTRAVDDLLETFPCDLCGRQNREFLYAKRGVLTNYPFRVVRCRSCGLIYLSPRLGDHALRRIYDESYCSGKGFDSHVRYVADFDKANDTDKVFRPEETLRIIRELVPPPSRLPDFGCGLGDLIRQAVEHGYRAEGFEVSAYAWRLGIKDSRDSYTVPEGHVHFFSTPVMKFYLERVGYSRMIDFEPKSYQGDTRLFRLLARLGLIEAEIPRTPLSEDSRTMEPAASRPFWGCEESPCHLARK